MKPYYCETSMRKRWLTSVLISLFVFVFLLFFQPFNLHSYPGNKLLLTGGYGLVTFGVLVLLNIVCYKIFTKIFHEEHWTTGKEILLLVIILLLIGFGNAIYTNLMSVMPLSANSIVRFVLLAIAVGIMPVTALTLFNQNRLERNYQASSAIINASLPNKNEEKQPDLPLSSTIKLIAENGKDYLELRANQIDFIKAADNYVEIFYTQKDQQKHQLLRNRLKVIAHTLEADATFFRCHKSYLVNLKKVNRISGNAQGYKLHLNGYDLLVPVSRSHNNIIKSKLTL